MKVDYFKLIKESAEFAWKYKVLWVFGFILAFLSGSGGNSNSSSYNFEDRSDVSFGGRYDETFDTIGEKFDEFTQSPSFWITISLIILVIIGVVLIFTVISWYLRRVAKLALMNSVKYDENGEEEKIKLKSLWTETHSRLITFLLYDLIWFAIFFPVVIISVGMAFLGLIGGPGGFVIALCCITFPLLFIFAIFVSGIRETGERFLAYKEDMQPFEAIKKSWDIFTRNFGKYFLAWLAMLLPGCGWGIVIGAISLITILPLLFMLVPIFLNPDALLLGIGVGGCGICLISLVMNVIQAPFVVFQNTYWTKFMRMLMGESKAE
ncbi:hypothetical protein JW766_01290 [Candidatus Dojkabacteria bacterium]|nr:hypothetical protein [Candidatus Dojkabacteria bacterium]